MIYSRSFPDLHWLKARIAHGFIGEPLINGEKPTHAGWPDIIIQANTNAACREDIKGTFSLFTNLSGESMVGVKGHQAKVKSDQYFISNLHQPYSLYIEQPAETFNIHFGEYFLEEVYSSLTQNADGLLAPFEKGNPISFFNQLYSKTPFLSQKIREIQTQQLEGKQHPLEAQEQLRSILVHLLQEQKNILAIAEKIPSARAATRRELYKKLAVVKDILHTVGWQEVDLDMLAKAAGLSKYHMIRLYKMVFGLSPYQYLQQIKTAQAQQLLFAQKRSIQETAFSLGFQDTSSFSRMYHKQTGFYPSQQGAALAASN
jgi:AraC family transcriptional regulator